MIDSRVLRRLLTASAVLLALAAGLSFALGQAAFAGGLLLGLVLGVLPIASWAWLVSRGLQKRRTQILAVVLAVAKLAAYPALLYALVLKPVVSGVGVFAGITGVVAVLSLGSLLFPPMKEAA